MSPSSWGLWHEWAVATFLTPSTAPCPVINPRSKNPDESFPGVVVKCLEHIVEEACVSGAEEEAKLAKTRGAVGSASARSSNPSIDGTVATG